MAGIVPKPTFKIHQYDPLVYDFAGRVQELLGGTPLQLSHTAHSADVTKAHDQNTTAHASFYRGFGHMQQLYDDFVRNEIVPFFEEDLCVQAVPTFRISMPGGVAVKEFHRDSDYHHQAGTVNFWLPLTKAFGANTVWVESDPDAGDFAPVSMTVGQYLEFDAIRLRHGNVPNDTGVSRVSFDFRVVPLSQYQDTGKATVVSGMKMALGSYYKLFRHAG